MRWTDEEEGGADGSDGNKTKEKKPAKGSPGKKGHRIGNAGAALSRLVGGMGSGGGASSAAGGGESRPSRKHAHRLTVVLFAAATRSHAAEAAFRLLLPLLRPGVDCLQIVNLALEPWKMLEGHQFVQELASVAADRGVVVRCHVLQAAGSCTAPSSLAAQAGLVAADLQADLAVVGSEALTERLASAVLLRARMRHSHTSSEALSPSPPSRRLFCAAEF